MSKAMQCFHSCCYILVDSFGCSVWNDAFQEPLLCSPFDNYFIIVAVKSITGNSLLNMFVTQLSHRHDLPGKCVIF